MAKAVHKTTPADAAPPGDQVEGADMADPAQTDLVEQTSFKRADGANVVALGKLVWLPIGSLFPSPLNPRKRFNEIEELAESIGIEGLLQPLTARAAPKGTAPKGVSIRLGDAVVPWHEVYVGGRRTRALALRVAQGKAQPTDLVPVNVRPATDLEIITIAMAENVQRRDLTPIEEAEGYAEMRRNLPKAEGDRRAVQSIARRLGVGERTIQRRLALLKLQDDVQVALRDGKLTLGQAEAFAAGKLDEQKRLLRRVLADTDGDSPWAPAWIREQLDEADAPKVADARFDVALYDGAIVRLEEEHESRGLMLDVAQFKRLQRDALDIEIAALKTKFAWVEEVAPDTIWSQFESGKGKSAELGAVVTVSDSLARVEIHERMARKKKPKAAATAGRGAASGRVAPSGHDPIDRSNFVRGDGSPAGQAMLLTNGQRTAVHHAKTKALRRGLIDGLHDHVALAITVLGLIGCDEIEIATSNSRAPIDRVAYDWHDELLGAALGPLVKGLHIDTDDLSSIGGRHVLNSEASAQMFERLVDMPGIMLAELHRLLVARRIGSWPGFNPHLGTTPLTRAIAKAVDAERHLEAVWQPSEEYFKAYGKDRLGSVCIAAGLPIEDLKGLKKKGDLVAAAMASPPEMWATRHFLELRFIDDGAMRILLEGGEIDESPARGDGLTAGDKAHGRAVGGDE